MSQQDAFERIVDSINEAMLDDARWQSASALIDEAVRSEGSILTFGDERSNGNSQIFFSKCYYRGVDRSAWQEEYFRDYYGDDEHLLRLRQLPDSKIVHVADLFSEEERKTSRMYNEALARFSGQDGLNVRLDGPRGSRIIWGIANPIDAGGWSSSQIDMIARVLPYLRQYVRVRSALVDATALGTSLTGLLDNTRAGVVQLDRSKRIVEASDRAMDLLRQNDGLSDRNGELCAAFPEDHDRLKTLLGQALPRFRGQGASGSMVVKRLSLLPNFVLHVKPVTNREEDYRSRDVGALVLIVDPGVRARINQAVVEAALGLTPVEAEIAALLAEGWTTRQIAAATGRGYSTVRTHLKHIFTKLGVSRQFEVAQLVLALSSLPTSGD